MDYETLIGQSRLNAAVEAEEFNIFSLLKPRIFIDGNQWCVLYGDNLQDGVAGFGNTPWRAVAAFNAAWSEPVAVEGPLRTAYSGPNVGIHQPRSGPVE